MVTIQCPSRRFEQIQGIVFDKDGTLADSSDYLRHLAQKRSRLIDAQIPGVQEPLLMAFGLEGQRLNPAGLMAVGSRYENEIAAAAYVAETGRDWLESLLIVRSAFNEADQYLPRKAEQTPPFEGVVSLIQTLAEQGIKLAVLSGDSVANIQDFLDCYGLSPMIPVAIGSDEGISKPNPILLHQACQQLDIQPQQTLLIGDTATDLELARAGQAAGFIGVTWGHGSVHALARADCVVRHSSDIQVVSPIP